MYYVDTPLILDMDDMIGQIIAERDHQLLDSTHSHQHQSKQSLYACLHTYAHTHTHTLTYKPLNTAEEHLMRATCERSLYRTVVKQSKDDIRQHFTTTSNEALSSQANNEALSSLPGTVFSPPPPGSSIPPGPACVHYSFDFAQQVHYPHNPLQPGPMYCKTARKCAIFGVCCEGLPRQINYLIDEASDTGKGANTVISFVHHFLAHHSMGGGGGHLHLHADNCAGQNKNTTFLQCCAWRVLSGLHQSVTMSFMLVGHKSSHQTGVSACSSSGSEEHL